MRRLTGAVDLRDLALNAHQVVLPWQELFHVYPLTYFHDVKVCNNNVSGIAELLQQ